MSRLPEAVVSNNGDGSTGSNRVPTPALLAIAVILIVIYLVALAYLALNADDNGVSETIWSRRIYYSAVSRRSFSPGSAGYTAGRYTASRPRRRR